VLDPESVDEWKWFAPAAGRPWSAQPASIRAGEAQFTSYNDRNEQGNELAVAERRPDSRPGYARYALHGRC